MIREETVFGPIHSRRLGTSLGINLLPTKGKLCNFDCVYCECGWNKDGREDTRLPSAAEVRNILEDRLAELMLEGVDIDYITFSGDGEPTLNPEFPRIIEDTIHLRDAFFPKARVAVLSNATRVHIPEIFDALCKVDSPLMKIDAPTNELAALINKPNGDYDVNRVVESLKKFNGNFILQTMFLRSNDFDSSSPEVIQGWGEIVRTLKPRKVTVYTIDRPTPATDLKPFTEEEMRSLAEPFIPEGTILQVNG